MEEKPDPETNARKELEKCSLLIKKNLSIGKREHVHADLQVDWQIISCFDQLTEAVKAEFQGKQLQYFTSLEKGYSGRKPTDESFMDKIFTQSLEELTLANIIKAEKIDWVDSLGKNTCILEQFEIRFFDSHFPLYGFMYSKSEEYLEVYQWQVVADAVGWYQDCQGMERYVIVKHIEVPKCSEFWDKHPDAYGKCLHQCLIQARLLQLHLKLDYLPHILIIPSGRTGQDFHPGLFFDFPKKCKEVIESFEWAAGLPMSPPNSFVSKYSEEFKHEMLLAEGGFGVVFQARHKVDDCAYAIKRVGPLCMACNSDNSFNDFIKREVKALATLDHSGIVRYYNSWFETPPVGWQYENEALISPNGTSSCESPAGLGKNLNTPHAGKQNGDSLDQKDSAIRSNVFSLEIDSNLDSGVSTNEKFTEDLILRETSSSEDQRKCSNKQCNADKLSAPLYLFIQMQLCGETLKDWLTANKKREHVFCLDLFKQILGAVVHIHDKGLMHRDLKPSNIFFSSNEEVKVGDFGLVTAYTSENDINVLISDDTAHSADVGTELYMSPEQTQGKAYSEKVDIFALGLIFFELFYSFGTEMERIKVITKVKEDVFPSDFETKMPLQAKLVTWLLSENPDARPNATDVENSDILGEVRQVVRQNNSVQQ